MSKYNNEQMEKIAFHSGAKQGRTQAFEEAEEIVDRVDIEWLDTDVDEITKQLDKKYTGRKWYDKVTSNNR